MKIVYLDTYPLEGIDLTPVSRLGDFTGYPDTAPDQVVARAVDAEVVLVNKVRLFKPELDRLPKLKLICVTATGTNNIDTDYAASKGIAVKNVPAYSTESVAEGTLAMVLALLRNIVWYDRYVKDGDYSRSGRAFNTDRSVREIRGRNWGTIGMGAIGKGVAELAAAFGAAVSYHSTSGHNLSAGYPHKTLEALLADSDIVTIHAPLNPQTENLITYDRLRLMKPTAILANMGRGKIVDESDLARALNEDIIAGAGLDVYAQEPPSADNPLLALRDENKVVLTPHGGWASEEARKTLVAKVAENIETFYNID